MSDLAFVLVLVVLVALVILVGLLVWLVDRQRKDARAFTERLLNALMADDAEEYAELQKVDALSVIDPVAFLDDDRAGLLPEEDRRIVHPIGAV